MSSDRNLLRGHRRARLCLLLLALAATPGCRSLVPRRPAPPPALRSGAATPLSDRVTVVRARPGAPRFYLNLGRSHGLLVGDRFRILRAAPAAARTPRGGPESPPPAFEPVLRPAGTARVVTLLPHGCWLEPLGEGWTIEERDVAVYLGPPAADLDPSPPPH